MITIEEFRKLRFSLGEWSPEWLERAVVYRLPNGDQFGRDVVLNEKLGERGIRLRRGSHVEGYVLGYIDSEIPAGRCSTADSPSSMYSDVSRAAKSV